VLTHPPNTTPIESGFSSTFQLPSAAKPQQDVARTLNARWQKTYDGDRILLSHLLRVELQGQVNISFLPRAVSIEGRQFKVTFRAQSALIEKERLEILLQPYSAMILWSNTF